MIRCCISKQWRLQNLCFNTPILIYIFWSILNKSFFLPLVDIIIRSSSSSSSITFSFFFLKQTARLNSTLTFSWGDLEHYRSQHFLGFSVMRKCIKSPLSAWWLPQYLQGFLHSHETAGRPHTVLELNHLTHIWVDFTMSADIGFPF